MCSTAFVRNGLLIRNQDHEEFGGKDRRAAHVHKEDHTDEEVHWSVQVGADCDEQNHANIPHQVTEEMEKECSKQQVLKLWMVTEPMRRLCAATVPFSSLIIHISSACLE